MPDALPNIADDGDPRAGKETKGEISSSPPTWDVASGLPLLMSDTTHTYIYGVGLIGMVDAQGNAHCGLALDERLLP